MPKAAAHIGGAAGAGGVIGAPGLRTSQHHQTFYEDNQLFTIDNIKQQISFDMFNNIIFKTDSIECNDEPMSPSDSIPSLDSLPSLDSHLNSFSPCPPQTRTSHEPAPTR